MNAWNRIGVIFRKETVDNFRDRRSFYSTLSYALLGPGMILLMIIVLGGIFRTEIEKPLELPVAGRENAPNLVQFLEQNNVIVLPAPADPRAAVRSGDIVLALIIPETYGEDFTAGKSATVQLVVDSSRTSASPDINRANTLLQTYSRQIGSMRLLARGVNPTLFYAVSLEKVDVSTPQSQAFMFLNMLPYFLIMTVFLGGMASIIDATAGERERGSLEPLLINPAARWEFVIGKLLSSLPFAAMTVLLTLVAFGLIFTFVPTEKFIGMRLTIDVVALGAIFLVCLPLVVLAGSVQMIVATFAHSFKEAQTYLGWLPLIPALPGIALAFLPVKSDLWTMLIPTFGQQILINQLIRGEVVSMSNIWISTLVTVILTAVLIVIAMRLYNREQILFSKKTE
ncbi:MAG: ABC transporter permease [Anaerolineae bacterium]|nr:ABC transporter permease [Anaerolineae bacterium]